MRKRRRSKFNQPNDEDAMLHAGFSGDQPV
jgi:hypothetical protein